MRLVLTLLTALLLLFADFTSAEHHHEDYQLHTDCSVCILQHSQIDTSSYKPQIKLSLRIKLLPVEEEPETPSLKILSKSTKDRAPPA